MRSSILAFASLALTASFATTASAQEATPPSGESPPAEASALKPSGFEFGARLGYAVPMGNVVDGGEALSHGVTGAVPILVDVGYRITPNWYVGAYGQYGFALVNSAECPSGVSCSAQSYRLGVNAHYHILPGQSFDPWIGLGTGYEWLHGSSSQGNNAATVDHRGFEIVNFQVGGDFRLSPNASVGPYASLSLSEYTNASGTLNGKDLVTDTSIASTALHEWLTFGVRGRFDL